MPEAEAQQVEFLSQKTRQNIVKVSIGVLAVVAVVLIYIFAVRNPAINSGNEAIGAVDIQAMNQAADNLPDSILLQGYADVAENHGGAAGNRATYMAAVLSYKAGDYEKALGYIENYSADDVLIAALACGIKGDCLVNLDRYEEAVDAFSEAISVADDNERLVPYFMTKKAVVLSALGKHSEAAAVYEEIIEKYPTQMPSNTNARMLQEKGLASSAE